MRCVEHSSSRVSAEEHPQRIPEMDTNPHTDVVLKICLSTTLQGI
jgi:hypothetical protein